MKGGPGSAWRGAGTAFRFLTVLPLPIRRDAGGSGDLERGWAVAFFPVVGVVVGGAVAGVLVAPVPALPRAALALLVWVAIAGGLHEDGWMDTLDAAFAPVAPERRLEILDDPRVGAHGATGGVLLQVLRFAALTTASPVAALVTPVVGRWAMVLSLAFVPPARGEGLGADFSRAPRWGVASLLAVSLLVVATAWLGAGRLLVAVAAAGIVSASWAWFLARRLGGLGGDGHGAVGVAAELAVLYALLP